MNETSVGNVFDYSGNSNTGTATGVSIVDGPFAGMKAKQGNGVSTNITFNDASNLHFNAGTSFTVLQWINPNFTTAAPLLSKYANFGYRAYLTTDGRVKFDWRSTTNYVCQTAASQVKAGWQLIGVTAIAQTGRVDFYSNGTAYGDNSNNYSPIFDLNTTNVPRTMYDSWNPYYSSSIHGALYVFSDVVTSAEQVLLASAYGDPAINAGYVYVRSWLTGSITLFGAVESAPVITPTVDPDTVTAEDALGVGVVFGFIALAVCVALIFSKRK
jgi:hypothetical protein